MCPREELNFHLILRSDLFYPLNYEGVFAIHRFPIIAMLGGFSNAV